MTVNANVKSDVRKVEYVRCETCGAKLKLEDGKVVNPCGCEKK